MAKCVYLRVHVYVTLLTGYVCANTKIIGVLPKTNCEIFLFPFKTKDQHWSWIESDCVKYETPFEEDV